jgi:phosphate:Na+ symporter
LARLRDESTSQFVDAVTRNLEQAIGTIRRPNASDAAQVVAAKRAIEELAAAARKSFLEKLQLADQKDVLSFRLARRIAEITKEW